MAALIAHIEDEVPRFTSTSSTSAGDEPTGGADLTSLADDASSGDDEEVHE